MRDGRLHREEQLDKLIACFGAERFYQRQKVDIVYIEGDAHALARQCVLASYHAINLQELRAQPLQPQMAAFLQAEGRALVVGWIP